MTIKKELIFINTKSVLFDAIFHLATEEGDLRARLKNIDAIYSLECKHFPNELQYKWKNIEKLLEKYPSDNEIGSIKSNLNRMKNKTASKIAIMIVELYRDISNFQDENI